MTTVNAAEPTAKAELRRADGQPVRVLVVDDESTLTELLSMALRYEGWDTRSPPGRPARPGCGTSSPTPATNCAPRSRRSAGTRN